MLSPPDTQPGPEPPLLASWSSLKIANELHTHTNTHTFIHSSFGEDTDTCPLQQLAAGTKAVTHCPVPAIGTEPLSHSGPSSGWFSGYRS